MRVKTKGGSARAIKGLGVISYFWTELSEEQLESFGREWPGKTLEDFGLEIETEELPEPEVEEEEEDN